jgi:hypothetical protein
VLKLLAVGYCNGRASESNGLANKAFLGYFIAH